MNIWVVAIALVMLGAVASVAMGARQGPRRSQFMALGAALLMLGTVLLLLRNSMGG